MQACAGEVAVVRAIGFLIDLGHVRACRLAVAFLLQGDGDRVAREGRADGQRTAPADVAGAGQRGSGWTNPKIGLCAQRGLLNRLDKTMR